VVLRIGLKTLHSDFRVALAAYQSARSRTEQHVHISTRPCCLVRGSTSISPRKMPSGRPQAGEPTVGQLFDQDHFCIKMKP
jgi:hypothetical protein